MDERKENPQSIRLRRVAELVLERLEGLLAEDGERKLDSSELKRIVSTLKDLRELQEEPREKPEEPNLFTVRLEGELEAFGA